MPKMSMSMAMSMPMMMAPADVVNFVAPEVNFELINFTNTNNIFIFIDYFQNLQTQFDSCLRAFLTSSSGRVLKSIYFQIYLQFYLEFCSYVCSLW